MGKPTLADYVNMLCNLIDRFMAHHLDFANKEIYYTYKHKVLIVFFILMQLRGIYQFKTQRRWLENHPKELEIIGFGTIPHRSTLSRRYKQAYPLINELIAFIGEDLQQLDDAFAHELLFEDKSLFKAKGPVWHKSDRQENHIPAKLRNLDRDAAWGKSGYQGWVYGYGLHMTNNQCAFPKLVVVESANISEKEVVKDKEQHILSRLKPIFFTTDNGYFSAMRIKNWAKKGVALITPAVKWVKGKYAKAYHQFIEKPYITKLFRSRKTTVEPLFDLIAKIIGTNGRQKQLPIKDKTNVSTCLALAALTLQISMIVNHIWGLPFRNIGHMKAVFT